MIALDEPSNNLGSIGFMVVVGRLCRCTNLESMKQCVDPESIRVGKEIGSGTRDNDKSTHKEFRSERVDALNWMTLVSAL